MVYFSLICLWDILPDNITGCCRHYVLSYKGLFLDHFLRIKLSYVMHYLFNFVEELREYLKKVLQLQICTCIAISLHVYLIMDHSYILVVLI